jgi:hypothetical protein
MEAFLSGFQSLFWGEEVQNATFMSVISLPSDVTILTEAP